MIMKANKQIGFIYKNNENIDKILKDGDVVFERGFLREKTSTTLPITFGGVGKDLKDYKVYGNTHQNSTSGKNLFLSLDTPSSRNLATYTKINDNSFSLNYTQNVSTFMSPFVRIDFDITKFKPNTQYTVSKKHIVEDLNFNRNGSIRTYINGVNGAVVNTNSITFTTPNEITSLGIYFYLGYENTTKGESTITFYDIQLEEGSVATEFEPYTGGQPSPNPDYPQEIISCGDLITDSQDENYGKYKIPVNVNNSITNIYLDEPLRKIGGYSDYIDFINGKVVRNIDEIILNGSEANLRVVNTGTNNWYYCFKNLNKDTPSEGTGYLLSNYYTPSKVYNANTNEGITVARTSKEIRIRYGIEETIESFRNWLSTNNLIVDYVLATPIEEDIELPNIPTIDGNNTLNIETEITPSQVYIKYKSNE